MKRYNLLSEAKKPSPNYLHSVTNKPLKTETRYICEDTTAELMNNDINYGFVYGGKKVVFKKDELEKIKKISTVGMKLIGFKPIDRLKTYHNYKSSSFIYPNDKQINGSLSTFSALYKKMIEMKKIAICRFKERETSFPLYVALVPQEEIFDNEGVQVSPPGFNVIYLPFADGIREIKNFRDEETPETDDEKIKLTKKLIKKLYTSKFSGLDIENPTLQKHYAALQALALEHDKEEDIQDLTEPDYKTMEKYSELYEIWNEKVMNNKDYKKEAPKKRKKEEGEEEDERKLKKAKTSQEGVTIVKKEKKVKKEVDDDEDDDRAKKLKKEKRIKDSYEPDDEEEEEIVKKKTKEKKIKKKDSDEEEDVEEEIVEIDMIQEAKTGHVNINKLKKRLKN
jgi:ATP-dependent DNA helicase II